MRIVKASLSNNSFKTMMADNYQVFLDHVSRVTAQYKAVHDLKQNLPPAHAIVQMDFAENFLCQTMDEIQSAYWNATAATIHPVVIYYKTETGDLEHTNLAFVSDVNQHNSIAVYAILRLLVPRIKTILPGVRVLHYWTDSPSSQYRNRFIFTVIARHAEEFGISARWNYFEAGHGKGPCDGIDGTCKRMAAQAIKQGKATIQDARDFFQWVTQNEKSIQFLFYSQGEYDAASQALSALHAKPVTGTLKIHAVHSTDDGGIHVRNTSCYCPRCLSWNEPCDGWARHTVYSNSVTSQVDIIVTDSPADGVNAQIDEQEEGPATVHDEGSTVFIPEKDQLIAALYDNAWYIGKVVEVDINDKDVLVNFMSKRVTRGNLHLQWPTRADEIWVSFDDLLSPVGEPVPIGRSMRYFTLSPDDLESVTRMAVEKGLPH